MTRERPARHRPPAERPEKICLTCGRPFAWRRRWAATWDQVTRCSERCRRDRPRAADGQSPKSSSSPTSR
ncbi:MAG: DUF2256 domain-containing protein [Chloroflexota bacterium]